MKVRENWFEPTSGAVRASSGKRSASHIFGRFTPTKQCGIKKCFQRGLFYSVDVELIKNIEIGISRSGESAGGAPPIWERLMSKCSRFSASQLRNELGQFTRSEELDLPGGGTEKLGILTVRHVAVHKSFVSVSFVLSFFYHMYEFFVSFPRLLYFLLCSRSTHGRETPAPPDNTTFIIFLQGNMQRVFVVSLF